MPQRVILVVDDDEADAVLLQSVFADAGIGSRVRVVTDGQQAVDYLTASLARAGHAQHPMPSLVLLDLKLPKRSGLEVLRWIRQHEKLRHLVVIVFSSAALPAEVRNAYAAGANSFVEKPVEYRKAADIGRALKAWWLDLNQYGQG